MKRVSLGGMFDRSVLAIVATLVVSENTVKGHVSNILSKLHLADRTQAAVMAWRAA